MMFRKKKVKAFLYADYGETWQLIAIKKVPIEDDKFEWKDKQYIIDLKKAIFDKKMHPQLHYNIKNSNPVTFIEDKIKADPTLLQTTMRTQVYSKLLGAWRDKYFTIIVIVLVIAIICISVYSIYEISRLTGFGVR